MSLLPPVSRLVQRPLLALAALALACAAAAEPAKGPATAPAGSKPGGASGAASAVPGAAVPAALPAPAPNPTPALAPKPAPAVASMPVAPTVAPLPAPAPAVPTPDTTYPREVEGLTRLATKLTERGDYATAEIAYWQILSRPDLAIADEKTTLLALAHLLRKQGQETRASAIYEKFVKEYPDDERVPEALLELGRTLREMGTYKLAINRFYSVINSTLKFPNQDLQHYELLAKTAQFEIAETHYEAGEYEEAGKFFARVRLLDLAPIDRAHATFMAAVCQNLAGFSDTAIASLKGYLDQFPNDENVPEARYLLATTLRQLKRPQEAMAVTLDLLRDERSKDKTDLRRWAYWQRRTGNQVANDFFQTGDTFNALAIYKGLLDLSAEPSWRLPIIYQIALCYERLRQGAAAKTAYEEIVSGAAVPPGGTAVPEELTELAQMATWRLAQLSWRDQADREINILLPASGSPSAPPPAAAPAPPPSLAHPS